MKPLAVLAAILFLTGCDVSSDPASEFTRGLGELLTGEPDTPTVTIAAQARPGVPVEITVTTRGGGCQKEGDTEVAFVEGAVEIRPYDLTISDPDRFCAAILTYYPHTVDVTFPEAGPAVVRAIGEVRVGLNPDGTFQTEPQTRELNIVVR